jgi:hypothetical protein
MIDITGPKVLVPTVLFALLSPELLIALPPGAGLLKQTLFHGLVLSILSWFIIKFIFKFTITVADLITPALLFIILTPGMILTIPPGSDGVLFSTQTSLVAVLVHATIFSITFASIRGLFPKYY